MQNNTEVSVKLGNFFTSKITIPLKERPPRVIVEIDKKETQKKAPNEEDGSRSSRISKSSMTSRTLERQVAVVDSTKLLFEMKSCPPPLCYRRTYNFDCIANGESDQMLRFEMGTIADRLFGPGCKNCCLLYFAPQRGQSTLHVLTGILIPELCKRLEPQLIAPLQLHAIEICEICDVRKYDIVNMLAITAPKGKPRHNVIVHNTWELTQWIQNIYPTLWAKGSGHENIEFKFVFVKDQQGTKIRRKLSIMQFFMNKMDADMSAGFRNFLENFGSPLNTRIRYSILTEYLREFFFSPDNWLIWMIFKIPIKKKCDAINEMLSMASAAYGGVQSLINGTTSSAQYENIFADSEVELLLRSPNLNGSKIKSKSGISMRSVPSSSLAHSASRTQKFENPTILSNWYRQFDEKVFNVLLAMEAFYIRKNRSINPVMLAQNSNAVPTKRNGFISTVRNIPKTGVQEDSRLIQLTLNYKKALNDLHTLIQEVEQSTFANFLKSLIQMKNNELFQHLNEIRKRYGKKVRPKAKNGNNIDADPLRKYPKNSV